MVRLEVCFRVKLSRNYCFNRFRNEGHSCTLDWLGRLKTEVNLNKNAADCTNKKVLPSGLGQENECM